MPARTRPLASVWFLPNSPLWVSTKSRTAKPSALSAARCHVGGFSSRRWAPCSRAARLRSSGVGGRPVRPRASTTPAALPRCLVRRLRFVWAIAPCESRGSPDHGDRALVVEHVERVLHLPGDDLVDLVAVGPGAEAR